MTAFISGAVIGFVAGWILLKRPQWVGKAVAWIKSKIGMSNG